MRENPTHLTSTTSNTTTLRMHGTRYPPSRHEGGAKEPLTRPCASCKALVSSGVLRSSLRTSRRSKVRSASTSFFLSFSLLSPDLVPTGELKILILGDANGGQGRAALRLHDSSDNDEDGYLWRMRSEDEAVLMAVKQVLAT